MSLLFKDITIVFAGVAMFVFLLIVAFAFSTIAKQLRDKLK